MQMLMANGQWSMPQPVRTDGPDGFRCWISTGTRPPRRRSPNWPSATRGMRHGADSLGPAEAAEWQLAFDELRDGLGIRLLPLVPRPAGNTIDRVQRCSRGCGPARAAAASDLAEADLGGLLTAL